MKRKQLPHHLAQSMQPYFSMYCLKKKGRKQNMAKYKQRKDGRYCTSVTLDGKRHQIYGKTTKEVNNKIIDLKMKHKQGLLVKSKGILFKDYKEEWFKAKKPLIGVKSAQNYRTILDIHCETIDYKKIEDIKKTDIQLLINSLIDKPNTANKVYMTLNQIMENAIDDDIILKNPCRRVIKPKIEVKKKRILTDEEFYLTEIAEFNDREKMFVILSKYCGLRPEETRALTKNDFAINNSSGYVIINKTVVYASNKPIFQQFTKNDSSTREIPIFSNVLPFVKYYLSTLSTEKLFTNITSKEDIYLTNQSYKWLIKKIIDKIKEKALEMNIEFNQDGFTPYIFRHTYATLLYYSGVRLKDAQYYMGHSDSKMLNEVYIHLDKQKLRENAIVENFINEKLKTTTKNIETKLLDNE